MIFILTLLRTYNERIVYSLDGRLDIVSLIVRDGQHSNCAETIGIPRC